MSDVVVTVEVAAEVGRTGALTMAEVVIDGSDSVSEDDGDIVLDVGAGVGVAEAVVEVVVIIAGTIVVVVEIGILEELLNAVVGEAYTVGFTRTVVVAACKPEGDVVSRFMT